MRASLSIPERLFHRPTGMDFGAVTTGTCLAAAGAAVPWATALGAAFVSGVL